MLSGYPSEFTLSVASLNPERINTCVSIVRSVVAMLLDAFFSIYFFAYLAIASQIQIRSTSITLPLAISINTTGGSKALFERDRKRARALYANGQAKAQGDLKRMFDVPISLTDSGIHYTASVGVGGKKYELIVDTGSSITWIGANPNSSYQPGPNSRNMNLPVSQKYGSADFSGKLYSDDVIIGSANISQLFGVATSSHGISGGADGILGIGPDGNTLGLGIGSGIVPTVTHNLFEQGFICRPLFGISFVPATPNLPDLNGALDFGATDNSKFIGDISYVPITAKAPSSVLWGIDQSITYGSANIPILGGVKPSSGIVDTGTTFLYLADQAYQAYKTATGATFDQQTGLLTVPDYKNLQSLYFHIGNQVYEFTPNAQIWPRAYNGLMKGVAGATYLVVKNLGKKTGSGQEFVNGFVFLQRFYSVYDIGKSRVGFAVTPHTNDTTN